MKLTVDRLDLLQEHEGINCSQTELCHFKPDVQAVIIAAGGATFREYDGSNYNRIQVIDISNADYLVARCRRCGSVVYSFHSTFICHADIRWKIINHLTSGFDIGWSASHELGGRGCEFCEKTMKTAVQEES
ncbi:MAG: hypothetical protein KDK05_06600 [Candidatus Competibacteraceae bacterium]|nr:hypothetical protein [Candidatus Competibacteraceae bacterium]